MPVTTLSIVTTISTSVVETRRTTTFPRWTFPCLSSILSFCRIVPFNWASWSPFPFFLPCHVRMNMFLLSSTSLLTSKIDNICLFFVGSFWRVCCCSLSSPLFFEKSTCSAVAVRGCHQPWVDPVVTSLRKETFQELNFDASGQVSNSNFSASILFWGTFIGNRSRVR